MQRYNFINLSGDTEKKDLTVIDNTLCLNSNYSTTRTITNEVPHNLNNPKSKVQTRLFLDPNPQRTGEGGLRTKGYFKRSYPGKPLVSIITVVFHGEKYIEETMRSVMNQTYDNVEYLIIDGVLLMGHLILLKNMRMPLTIG